MVTLSAFSDEVTHNLDEQIQFLVANNVTAMEIRFVDGENIVHHTRAQVEEIEKQLSGEGIGVSAVGTPIGKVRLDEPFAPHLDLFKQSMDIADLLGTTNLRVFSFYAPEGENIDNYQEAVLDRMHQMLNLMVGSGLKLVHENEAGIFGHSAKNCALLAKELDAAYFTLAYDPANFVWGEKITTPSDVCWPLMRDHVGHIHIKDWTLGASLGSFPGEGNGQIPELIQALATMQYEGFMTMEPHLSKGGQFGGETGEQEFVKSIENVREMARNTNMELQ